MMSETNLSFDVDSLLDSSDNDEVNEEEIKHIKEVNQSSNNNSEKEAASYTPEIEVTISGQ